MAITCYVCAPQLSDLSVENCKEPKNVFDCDKDKPKDGMKYDSCFSITAKVEQGTEVTQRFCGIKVQKTFLAIICTVCA